MDKAERFPASSLNPMNGYEPTAGVVDHVFVRPALGLDVRWDARFELYDRDVHTGLYPSDHKALVASMTVM